MHVHTRRAALLTALAAAGAAVAVGTAGCGSSSVSNALDPVAKAATVSNAAPGERVTMNMRIETPQLPTPMTATGSGTFTPAQHTGQMTLSMDFSSIPQAASELGSPTLTMRELIKRTTVYIGLPKALAAHVPGGKPWLELDVGKLAASQGIPGLSSMLDNPTSSNPTQMLQYLRGASGGVTKVGTATIGGRRTTEYRATIDLAHVADAMPAADRAAVRQATSALERMAGVKRFPVQVWIDAQHLVRQMSFQFTEHLSSTGQTMRMAMTMDIPQYGPQPAPSFPPAGQVTNLGSLLSGAGTSTSGTA